MLENILMDKVVKQFLQTSNPTLNSEKCINRKQRKLPCHDCKDICPKEVYKQESTKPDWNKCTNCNLCVSACRSRCISSSKENMDKYFDLFNKTEDYLTFSCDNEEERTDVNVKCLAALPWELIAGLALRKELYLNVGGCNDCENELAITLLQDNLQKVLDFLGAERFVCQIHIVQDSSELPQRGYTRRDVLSTMVNKSKSALSTMIKDEDFTIDGLVYRRLLHYELNKLAQENTDSFYYWRIPVYNADCWGCGICTKVCSGQALTLSEPQSDGLRYMQFSPLKCSQCGLCQKLCPNKGIDRMGLIKIRDLSPVAIHKIKTVECTRCKKVIRPGSQTGLCISCERKAKRR